jgi:hypothetical protein
MGFFLTVQAGFTIQAQLNQQKITFTTLRRQPQTIDFPLDNQNDSILPKLLTR